MEIRFTLALPRDAMTVPLVRRILNRSLEVLGVARECRGDVELALAEACTNVLDHVVEGDEYEVSVGIHQDRCVIEVLDRGHGFAGETLGHVAAELTAEEGRGLQLIRALVDNVRFGRRDEPGSTGSVVHLEKHLSFVPGAPARRLAAANPPSRPSGEPGSG